MTIYSTSLDDLRAEVNSHTLQRTKKRINYSYKVSPSVFKTQIL
jgi:hypothetical protein